MRQAAAQAAGQSARQDVLSRKADAARRVFEARAMSPAKALRRALSRSADVLWDLALVAKAVDQEHLDQDGVVAQLPPEALLLLLDGPEGVVGFVTLERDLVVGLTEVQTMLQVTQMPADPRPFTATDAAMAAPLLDATLERFARFLEDHPLRAQIEGFRFGAMLEDARAAGMLLDAPGYMMFRTTLDLALGRRRGELRLFLPERPGARRAAPPGQPGAHEQKMELLPAQMQAVLGALRLPLGRVQALQPGDLLPLAPEVLERVTFYTGPGTPVAGGRLGQMNGMRAVRLTWPRGAGSGEGRGPVGTLRPSPAEPRAVTDAMAEPQEVEFDEMASGLPDLPDLPDPGSGDFDFSTQFGGTTEGEAGSEDAEGAMADFDFDFSAAPLDNEQ
ncbi:FliM/FliN family flagellar motor switch protein [Alloyangia pacifica]|uniref:Type III flagellar switch regulator (C-ring) FliN C-term n=1 Tax=Alloyangia pacifica TaxID=311180 RepID=A0A1I6NRT1_9RHOB|nr:flagellar motor switch protein FliM [Alloyangia pacifica]SDH64275.1 Type III flagellar switch regulator (C-ring) FliN C-term [Alloyangia pacifica]SFS30571.1 Type III flagellar switch regulator (C-ring) FliN C-term [Alloyangia pacifica]